VRHGHWPQQDCVHNAENRRVGRHSERQRYDCHERESRRFPQRSQSKSNVLQEIVHMVRPLPNSHAGNLNFKFLYS
jgi:hypothetical protein